MQYQTFKFNEKIKSTANQPNNKKENPNKQLNKQTNKQYPDDILSLRCLTKNIDV